MGHRIGIGVGGTFTDMIVVNEDGRIDLFKSSTTPDDISIGIFKCVEKAFTYYGGTAERFVKNASLFVHGTTVATNTILQHKGAKTGLITTKGFRDSLEMRRAHKPDIWDLFWTPPQVLVPRFLRLGVTERIDYKGSVIKPLDEAETREIINKLKHQDVKSI
ncbi:unnamed protein product, partial [marine sediment metagenome]